MIAECARCGEARDCRELGEANPDPEQLGGAFRLFLLQCPECLEPLLGLSEAGQDRFGTFIWGPAARVWPDPDVEIGPEIPEVARRPLIEAFSCFKVRAYDACAVMCGRAIEGACQHLDEKTLSIHDGLVRLKELGVIDSRLYDWGEALRFHRNLSAHPSEESVSRETAQYLLDFASAFCQYVFVLNAKWERFKQNDTRKSNKSLHPTASGGG